MNPSGRRFGDADDDRLDELEDLLDAATTFSSTCRFTTAIMAGGITPYHLSVVIYIRTVSGLI